MSRTLLALAATLLLLPTFASAQVCTPGMGGGVPGTPGVGIRGNGGLRGNVVGIRQGLGNGGALGVLGQLQGLQALAGMQRQLQMQQQMQQMHMQQARVQQAMLMQQRGGLPNGVAGTRTSSRTTAGRDVSEAAARRAALREKRRAARFAKLRQRD